MTQDLPGNNSLPPTEERPETGLCDLPNQNAHFSATAQFMCLKVNQNKDLAREFRLQTLQQVGEFEIRSVKSVGQFSFCVFFVESNLRVFQSLWLVVIQASTRQAINSDKIVTRSRSSKF